MPPVSQLPGFVGHLEPVHAAVAQARAFALPLLTGQVLDTGEPTLEHAEGVAQALASWGAAPDLVAAAYLVYAGDHLQRPEDTLRKAFGPEQSALVTLTRQLVQIQRNLRLPSKPTAKSSHPAKAAAEGQVDQLRKMLLAFSRDLRVVLLRLASRLQTLRWYAASAQACPADMAQETLQVLAPLAHRLGLAQWKWELEDLAFRYLDPTRYAQTASLVEGTRAQRQAAVAQVGEQLEALLRAAGIGASVHGRPKHLYSLWRKMQRKRLPFERVFDVLALRILVPNEAAAYAALAQVHQRYGVVAGEFEDYIARPKANGYQSLHTVVVGDDGKPLEVQIRTQSMHDAAEHGVAAHWLYKEGAPTPGAPSGGPALERRIAQSRRALLQELLAWREDAVAGTQSALDAPLAEADDSLGHGPPSGQGVQSKQATRGVLDRPRANSAALDDRVYVFTPQGTILDLPPLGTALDFAYSLHTELGHRCRGAKVDGALLPLNTPLHSGQTVELVVAKEGGPSLDWLNCELGFLQSARAKSKVRAWFNAQAATQTAARGREQVEKLLAREGKTAVKLEALAEQLGFEDAQALFELVGKDEYSLRNIELWLRQGAQGEGEAARAAEGEPEQGLESLEEVPGLLRPSRGKGSTQGQVLVVGVDSLLTQLARCCRPLPPEPIAGFVTRGKGVAVHRSQCTNLKHIAQLHPGRVIEVQWGHTPEGLPKAASSPSKKPGGAKASAGGKASTASNAARYPVDLTVLATDRQGLLRDITEVFTREQVNVTGARTQSLRGQGTAILQFTAEVANAARLAQLLTQLAAVPGVNGAHRR